MHGNRVEVQQDPRGGFIVMVRWTWQNDDLKSVESVAATSVQDDLLLAAICCATGAAKVGSGQDPFRNLPKRGA